jgi:hypothetical protein
VAGSYEDQLICYNLLQEPDPADDVQVVEQEEESTDATAGEDQQDPCPTQPAV